MELQKLAGSEFRAHRNVQVRKGGRRYLRALVNTAGLWNPRYGNTPIWLERGLPYSRGERRKLGG